MLQRLQLRNFRNYELLDLHCDVPVTVLLGDNGQGKTNILEAIYYLSYLRSFRTTTTNNLKNYKSNSFFISGEISNYLKIKSIYTVEVSDVKIMKINGFNTNKTSEFILSIIPVVFKNDDLEIIKGSSITRRKYFDIVFSSIDRKYFLLLKDYQYALKSRNAIIRKKIQKNDYYMLDAFETIMAEKCIEIIKIRKFIIKKIRENMNTHIRNMKGRENYFDIKYFTRIKDMELNIELIKTKYEKERKKDQERKYTLIGPHMDEYEFHYNGMNLRSYGSIGQCRLGAISLKMSSVDLLVESYRKKHVIILVDDVTGELDEKTKFEFYSVIGKADQVFYTLTKNNDVIKKNEKVNAFKVENGKIKKL